MNGAGSVRCLGHGPRILYAKIVVPISSLIEFYMFFRLVNSTGTSAERLNSPDLTFGTRTGSRKGVEAHLFRAETPRELAHWCRSIIEGAHSAAALIKEINCGEL